MLCLLLNTSGKARELTREWSFVFSGCGAVVPFSGSHARREADGRGSTVASVSWHISHSTYSHYRNHLGSSNALTDPYSIVGNCFVIELPFHILYCSYGFLLWRLLAWIFAHKAEGQMAQDSEASSCV